MNQSSIKGYIEINSLVSYRQYGFLKIHDWKQVMNQKLLYMMSMKMSTVGLENFFNIKMMASYRIGNTVEKRVTMSVLNFRIIYTNNG